MAEPLTPEEHKMLEHIEQKLKEKPKEEKKPEIPKIPKVKGLTARYEIIEIKDGCNLHKFLEEPLSKRSYEKERFLISRNIVDKLKKRIRFLVVFKSPAKEGDKPVPVVLSDKVEVNSRLLYTVKTSNTLRSALASLFKKPFSFGFGGKKILFIVVIIAVGVVAYFIYTGQLNLGSLLGQSHS